MRAPTPRRARFAILAGLALALVGCDSFSLPDQFLLPGEGDIALSLTVDKSTAERLNGTVGLLPSGGSGAYTFEITADDLYSGTSTHGLGSISGLSYTAGGAIGKIRIMVRDDAGSSGVAYVSVLPSTPMFTIATSKRLGSGADVNLFWSYADTDFDRYRLELAIDSQSYSEVPGSSKATTSYTGNSLPDGNIYYYRLFTIAGSYESAPALISLPRP
jgi:hypothetical protein